MWRHAGRGMDSCYFNKKPVILNFFSWYILRHFRIGFCCSMGFGYLGCFCCYRRECTAGVKKRLGEAYWAILMGSSYVFFLLTTEKVTFFDVALILLFGRRGHGVQFWWLLKRWRASEFRSIMNFQKDNEGAEGDALHRWHQKGCKQYYDTWV